MVTPLQNLFGFACNCMLLMLALVPSLIITSYGVAAYELWREDSHIISSSIMSVRIVSF